MTVWDQRWTWASMIFMGAGLELVVPADPRAEAAAHDLLEVPALQPRQLLGEEGDALAIGAGHAGDVGAPEQAVWPIGVEDAVQPVLDVLERIGLGRVVRRAGHLDGDIGQL